MAQGYSTKQVLDPAFQLPSDYSELVKVYKTMAKAADQRLVRLESYAHDPNMGDALKWSYARAMKDIEVWSGSEAKRFNTAPPAKKQSLLAKIADIKHFLDSPTSTKVGIKTIYQDRAKSINDKYGTNFTWQNVGDFYESEFYAQLDSEYASGTAVEAIGQIQKNKSKVLKALDKMEEEKKKKPKDKKIIRVKDDDILTDIIDQIIREHPDEVRKLLENG